jgi:hypothetical protein
MVEKVLTKIAKQKRPKKQEEKIGYDETRHVSVKQKDKLEGRKQVKIIVLSFFYNKKIYYLNLKYQK